MPIDAGSTPLPQNYTRAVAKAPASWLPRFSEMLTRSHDRTWTFKKAFVLAGVDRLLQPGSYRVVTDEELIEGLSFHAYRRVATMMFVPGPNGLSLEMVTIDPAELEAAHERDVADE